MHFSSRRYTCASAIMEPALGFGMARLTCGDYGNYGNVQAQVAATHTSLPD